MRLLLTGFEPFGGSDINSSWETASRIRMQSLDGVNLEVRQLPVSFKRVGDHVRGLLHELQPDVLVMLGQRASAQSIDVERIAVNLMDAAKTDNDGFSPEEEPVYGGGEAAYFSNLPVKELRDALLETGVASKVSNSAGLYVCNCAYYSALHAIRQMNLPTKVVFLHLPKLSEDFPFEKMATAVCTIIEKIKLTI